MTGRRRVLSGMAVGVLAAVIVHMLMLILASGMVLLIVVFVEDGIWLPIGALYFGLYALPAVLLGLLLAPLILLLYGVSIGGIVGYASSRVQRDLRLPFGIAVGALAHFLPMLVPIVLVTSGHLQRGDLYAVVIASIGMALLSTYPLLAGMVIGGICAFATLDWPLSQARRCS